MRTIDTPALEAAIIRNCAPTLAGMKPAALFTFPGEFVPKPCTPCTPAERSAYDERRHQLESAVAECARALSDADIRLRVLVWRPCGALLYAWRPHALARHLSDPRAQQILAQAGYPSASPETLIERLTDRLADDACTRLTPGAPCGAERAFPHEIGLFLGYPYHDVAGFIEHKGQNYLACGLWKVYADRDEALELFARFKRCTHRYLEIYESGVGLERLAAACA